MRFLGYTLADEAEPAHRASSPDMFEKMGEFVEEATKAGVIVATGGIAPTPRAPRSASRTASSRSWTGRLSRPRRSSAAGP